MNKRGDMLTVSKHAIERYCERILKYNKDKLKDINIFIYIDNLIKSCLPTSMYNGKYPLSVGGIAVVKNNTIVTIIM